jgi:murein DD-endopeptidase MepM/ murein hydrolase activator NlpD
MTPRRSTRPSLWMRESLSHRSVISSSMRVAIFLAASLVGFAVALEASEVSPDTEGAHVSSGPGLHDSLLLASDSFIGLTPPPVARPSASLATLAPRKAPAPLELMVTRGTLQRGQSLSAVLRTHGISASETHLIDRTIRPEFDFRRARPGDSFYMTRRADGTLETFRYRISPVESIYLYRDDEAKYRVRREYIELKASVARVSGGVQSSLYRSISKLGHDPALASEFADIFAWDIDFTRQLRRGDQFEFLYERLYRVDDDGSKVYVRPGQIVAAHFEGSAGEFTAVYFEEDNGYGNYYRPDGHAVEREFLAAPLKFSRISSNYSPARKHPILRVVRPHHGIDYAAREGTKVYSVADGEITFAGWGGGFGNLVKIRHANALVSYYAHLSGFGPGLRVGQKVLQKQVIGFVGQTGLATGPHVCYRVTKHGSYIDPITLNRGAPVKKSVQDESWGDFQIVRDMLVAGLRGSEIALVENAL